MNAHERNTAETLFHASVAAGSYYDNVAEALEGAPTNRLFWWRVRLMCRVASWLINQLALSTLNFTERR